MQNYISSHFSLPALSVDPGAEAGGGWCPEAWQSCRGTQHCEFFRNTLVHAFFLFIHLIIEGHQLIGCGCFKPNRC